MPLSDRTTPAHTHYALLYPAPANPPPSPQNVLRPAGSDPLGAGLQRQFSAPPAATPIPGQASECSVQSSLRNETPLRSPPHGCGRERRGRQFQNRASDIQGHGTSSLDQKNYAGEGLRRDVLLRSTSATSDGATRK